MRKHQDQPAAKAALRRKAEAQLKGKPATKPPADEVDRRRLQHELEVHQIELEMQNEELQISRAEVEAGLERSSDLFDFAPVGYFDLAIDGTIRLVNLAGASLVGHERAELKGQCFRGLVTKPSQPSFSNFLQQVFATKTRQTCDLALVKKDRTLLNVHLEAIRSLDGGSCRVAMFDITERERVKAVLESRVRLSEYALGHSVDELLTRTLDEAELLTGSMIGFFHFVEADQKTLSLQTWSTNTRRNMCTADGKGRHYEADQAGVWVDALRERRPTIHNDYASLPHRKGLPPGHAPVLRELVVPILRNKQVVALLGVGNKPGEYGPEDIKSVSGIANLAWDIVLIKQAEEALKRSQHLLAETEKIGKVGGWEFDIETGKQTWTEAVYHIHEVDFTYDPTVEKGVGFYTPASRPIVERAVKAAVERGEPFDLELEITTAKGNHRSVKAIGKADPEHHRVYGFFQDITERKQAEEKTARLAREWQTTFDATNDGIWLLDKEQRVLRSNKTADQLFRGPGREAVGHYCWEIIHGTTGPFPDCPIERARKSLHRENMELLIGDRWYRVTADPILDAAGDFAGAIHIVRDITERKRLAAEREQLLAKNLQLQKAESLGRMAGAIAHKFNNQLQVVILNLELALEDLPPDASSGANLSEAMASARQAADISGQMLTYLGQTHLEREPLDLSETCRRGLPLFLATFPNAAGLETVLPAPGPVIDANANQIQRVLIQLLTNAWEATNNGAGTLRLMVKLVPATAIPETNRRPLDWQPRQPVYACLEVADSGCGIAAEDIEKLYDPFFTSKFTGRGLGLSIVLGIVREHGGSITVESEPGRGSVFRVFLPLTTVAAVPPQPSPPPPAQVVAGRGTVMVVDDESSLRIAVTRALQRLGFKVFAAVDGVEAVELFGQHRDEIDCVLCDLTMPRMDGWETLTALRKLAPGLPVILSSGYDDAKVMEGHHPELPQAFLHKPYEFKALLNTINQVWPEARAKKGK
jgi:PAS domain S-box-containing protein